MNSTIKLRIKSEIKNASVLVICAMLLLTMCACGSGESTKAVTNSTLPSGSAEAENGVESAEGNASASSAEASAESSHNTETAGADKSAYAEEEKTGTDLGNTEQEQSENSEGQPGNSEEQGEPQQSDADIARSLIDHDVSELYEAIGEPLSSDYAPSCLIDGEDGNLYYDGFTVYTLKKGDSETVYDVE